MKLPDGQGVYYDRLGRLREGYWQMGVMTLGREILPSGEYYDGTWPP